MKIWSFPGIYPFPEGNDLTTGIFIHKQNKALKNIGVEVEVVQPWDVAPFWPLNQLFTDWKRFSKNTRPHERTLEGVKIYHPKIFTPKPSRLFNKPHEYYLLNTLEQFFKEKGVQRGKDMIHAQWLIPDGRIAVLLAQRLGIHVSVEMQGDDIVVWPHSSETHKKHALWTLDKADLILGCSDFLCKQAEILFKDNIEAHTIYTGIDVDKFVPVQNIETKLRLRQKYGLAEDELVILNVGSAIERKGWLELFQAVAKLKIEYPKIKILAASGGIQDFKLAEKAREYGVEEHLLDLGQVKNEQLLELYQLSDVFALPSYWEGLANVLCEAMSCGCAVVTSAVAGHPEVVENGVNGFLIEPKSVVSLTEALGKLLGSRQLREQFGANARITAEKKIKSHEANAEKLAQLFKDTLNQYNT